MRDAPEESEVRPEAAYFFAACIRALGSIVTLMRQNRISPDPEVVKGGEDADANEP